MVELSDTPKYNIKTVCARTGIRPETLRAWERRYQVVQPQRTSGNYRLYSDRDVAVLRWLKRRVDSGVPISRAVAELAEKRDESDWPEPPPLEPEPRALALAPPLEYARRLYQALIQHNESGAAQVLAEAHALFDLATVCHEIIGASLVEIGEAWATGAIRITTEHFASNFLRGRVMALFQALPADRSGPRIVVGCAPGELHDIASLMLALLLRRDGLLVEFLGPDLHLGDLLSYAREARPQLICLSAGTAEVARELRGFQAQLARLRPRPQFGFGGRAFNRAPGLRQQTPGLFLGETVPEGSRAVRQLLAELAA